MRPVHQGGEPVIRRARTKADLELADRLARRCGPRNGKLPSSYVAPGKLGAVWLAYVEVREQGGPGWEGHDEPAGVAAAYVDQDGVLWMTTAGALPAFRGRGIQRRLLSARLAWGRRCKATSARSYCSADNGASLGNLLRAGFVVAGYRLDELASGGGWVDVVRSPL